jgi:hypothetical protein
MKCISTHIFLCINEHTLSSCEHKSLSSTLLRSDMPDVLKSGVDFHVDNIDEGIYDVIIETLDKQWP